MKTKIRTSLLQLLAAVMLAAVVLTGCANELSELSLSITIYNETEYEIQEISFVVYGKQRPYYFPIIDAPLSPGESREIDVSMGWIEQSEVYAEVEAPGAVMRYDGTQVELNENVKGFVIFYHEETDFSFAEFYHDAGMLATPNPDTESATESD